MQLNQFGETTMTAAGAALLFCTLIPLAGCGDRGSATTGNAATTSGGGAAATPKGATVTNQIQNDPRVPPAVKEQYARTIKEKNGK